MEKFDILVIGAGHAGLESAFIAAKFGLSVGLFNMNKSSVANLPCNPSIGGPAKGVVTREIDALGGIQAIAADATKLQIKKLNSSKGPGVWAYRAQIDKEQFHNWFIEAIESNKNIHLISKEVKSLIIEDKRIVGLSTVDNEKYIGQAVIITCGVYLGSELYRDKKFSSSGPDGNPASHYLLDFFKSQQIKTIRLKTGTSPRIYKDSIDFSKLTIDPNNDPTLAFSLTKPIYLENQMDCYLSETTEKTFSFINENKEFFGAYNGSIAATGPRYCPSIEDKIFKFPHRKTHHIFVEPISKDYDYYYLAGVSTSLAKHLQEPLIKTLKGFENARIKSYAYSIAYDAIQTSQLTNTLELKGISGLYFAGQVCGTSGYEEAAAQGLMAGINASLKIKGMTPFVLSRHESYIGLLIDDLINGETVNEPYRLLTSRMESRMFVRNDNVDERLLHYGHRYGLIESSFYEEFKRKCDDMNYNIKILQNNYASKYKLENSIKGPITLSKWLVRGSWPLLLEKLPKNLLRTMDSLFENKLLINIKCLDYIEMEQRRLGKFVVDCV